MPIPASKYDYAGISNRVLKDSRGVKPRGNATFPSGASLIEY